MAIFIIGNLIDLPSAAAYTNYEVFIRVIRVIRGKILSMNIRRTNLMDAEQIAEIYNFYILNSHHTFETEAITADEMRKRIGDIMKNYPYLVAEIDGTVFGYAYAALYKPRRAYRFSVEISVYVKHDSKRKGIGKMLYERLFAELEKTETRAIIAGISLPNDASIRLHEHFGFEKIAHFREVGFKFGRWIDVGYWEKINDFSPQIHGKSKKKAEN